MHHYFKLHAALFALVLPACGPEKGATESTTAATDTDPSGGSTSSGATESMVTTEATTPTDATNPTDATSPTDANTTTTTAASTTGEDTTGETTMGAMTGETTTTTGGTTTTGETTSTTGGTTTGDESTTGDTCLACAVTLQVERSTSMLPAPGNTLLGTVIEQGAIVWAIDEVEDGRVAYAGQEEMLNREITQCGLWEWLADTDATPRVLSTGNFICDVQPWNGLGKLDDFTYSDSLPDKYVGDPAALRADFDVVIYCVSNFGGPAPIDAQTYVDYVKLHGGGLYLAAVQVLDDPSEDIDRINEIAAPLGLEFQPDNIEWNKPASADFACFPEQMQP